MKFACLYRRTDPQIIKNTYPVHLRSHVKQIWVVKGMRPPNMVDSEIDNKFNKWSSRKV